MPARSRRSSGHLRVEPREDGLRVGPTEYTPQMRGAKCFGFSLGVPLQNQKGYRQKKQKGSICAVETSLHLRETYAMYGPLLKPPRNWTYKDA